tara:strand:- start:34 stop:618 length:585 start_codon:yes stop_codon:yes gene_type:complete
LKLDKYFDIACRMAIKKGLISEENKAIISESKSGLRAGLYTLRDEKDKILFRVEEQIIKSALKNEPRRKASEWALSMGYPVPKRPSGCLSFILVLVGLFCFIIPGILILGWVWYVGTQWERDMDSLVAKWVDAGKPEPGEETRVLEIEKIEEIDNGKESNFETQLNEINAMKDKGLISEEEYKKMRNKILGLDL